MAIARRAQVPPIILELSDEEAEVVKHLTGSIVGLGAGRKIADRVNDALETFGVADNDHGLRASVSS